MSAARLPNFLFLLPDQYRYDWLGTNPALPLRTPHLDRLSAQGVRFTHATSPSPLCAPARACHASGRVYERCGVPNNKFDYPLDQSTYYQALRDAGYRVAGVGKFDLPTGVALAMMLVASALAIHREMATFAEAGVSGAVE